MESQYKVHAEGDTEFLIFYFVIFLKVFTLIRCSQNTCKSKDRIVLLYFSVTVAQVTFADIVLSWLSLESLKKKKSKAKKKEKKKKCGYFSLQIKSFHKIIYSSSSYHKLLHCKESFCPSPHDEL